MLYSVSMNALQHREDLGMAALEKTGPNVSLWVIWAICFVFVYFLFLFLFSFSIFFFF